MATDRKDSNITSLSEFRKATNTMPPEREKPAELLKRKGEAYPVSALGAELSAVVKEIQRVVQAPMGICAQSVLAAVSYATQYHANIHIDSQIIPLSLFFFTVAQSGERKSATDGIACKPIADYERVLQHEYMSNMQAYEDAINVKGAKIRDIPKPCDPVILMQEPTFEGLIKVYESGQSSLALFSDEGGHFLSGHAMSADNRIKTATGLSSLWDGAPIGRVRAGETNVKLYDKRLAFHLMIQPGIALKLFGDKGLVDQGFMSRCLLTYPESTMGNRQYVEENIYESPVYQKYQTQMLHLLAHRSSAIRILRLSPAARVSYLEFYYKIESELEPMGELRDIAGFANKMLNQACRIAGVLTTYENPLASEISGTAFINARRLVEHYQSENVRLIAESTIKLAALVDEEKLLYAKKLIDWIRRKDVIEKHHPDMLVKLRIMRANVPRAIRDKDTLMGLMNILVEYGYVNAVPGITNIWELVATP